MPTSFGYRARTRDLFSRKFREHGMPSVGKYLITFKVGDYVDIVANSAVHKGMPHKYYQGKTGRVWNVTPRAVGVEISKKVGNRIINKRIHVRVEHVQKSKTRDAFLARVKSNEEVKQALREGTGSFVALKRLPAQPKKGGLVRVSKKSPIETVTPFPHEDIA